MAKETTPATGRDSIDAVIEVYKRGVDRTLLRENLAKTPTERLQTLQQLQRFAEELRRAGSETRKQRG